MAASGADAHEKSMQWTRRLGGSPGRLDKHGARVTTADLADATVMGGSQSRLTDPRVQSEIAHQLLRAFEPADIADRCYEPSGDCQVHAGDRNQFVDCGIIDRTLRNLAIQQGRDVRHALFHDAGFAVGQVAKQNEITQRVAPQLIRHAGSHNTLPAQDDDTVDERAGAQLVQQA